MNLVQSTESNALGGGLLNNARDCTTRESLAITPSKIMKYPTVISTLRIMDSSISRAKQRCPSESTFVNLEIWLLTTVMTEAMQMQVGVLRARISDVTCQSFFSTFVGYVKFHPATCKPPKMMPHSVTTTIRRPNSLLVSGA